MSAAAANSRAGSMKDREDCSLADISAHHAAMAKYFALTSGPLARIDNAAAPWTMATLLQLRNDMETLLGGWGAKGAYMQRFHIFHVTYNGSYGPAHENE
jgi:hypothetical protein